MATTARLTPDRERRLAELPGWTWDILAELWEQGFNKLLDYAEEHGHPRVPHSYTTPDGYRLGSWAATQRGKYKSGALDLISGAGWQTYRAGRGMPSMPSGRRASGVCRNTSNTMVTPKSQAPTEAMATNLGRGSSLNEVARAKGELASDRQLLLQDLSGWTWNILDAKWEEGFRRLQEYVEHHGDTRIPSVLQRR